MRQLLALALAVLTVAPPPGGLGRSAGASALGVRPRGEAPAAERSASELAQRLLSHLRHSRDGFEAFSSITNISALGTSRPDAEHTVVGLRANAHRGGRPMTLYTVVVLRHGATGYMPGDAIFTCDPEGHGVAFPLRIGSRSLVVALGAGHQPARLHPYGIAVQPDAAMQGWRTDSIGESSAVLLRSGRTDQLCDA